MKSSTVLKISSILWAIWGAFHLFIGLYLTSLLIEGHPVTAMQNFAAGADPQTLQINYPAAVVAALKQHTYNLGWFGLVVLTGSIFVWRQSRMAIYLCALVGGLGDLGYFSFVDLGGFAAPPGPQMTWISGSAIILSFWYLLSRERS
ncbi:hypothetical protein L4C34_04600 [Vibrio profundum]|uniref:hypothetical protein n=1 Tax=Vibrio profundum TaxID=2910247 RepID=UPI003D0E9BE0